MSVITTARRVEHLERAQEIRLARAELKRRLMRRELSARDVIDAPPDCALTMRVIDLLRAQRGWGRDKADRLLVRVSVDPRTTVGRLSVRQRDGLLLALARQLDGLDWHKLAVLRLMPDSDGALASELARHCGKDAPALGTTLRGLKVKGWVRSEPATRDRARWFLTDDGRALVRGLVGVLQ